MHKFTSIFYTVYVSDIWAMVSRAIRPAHGCHVDMAGAGPQTVCEIERLSNTGTLAKLYQLDTFANSNAEFGRRILMLAGASTEVEELNANPDTFSLQ